MRPASLAKAQGPQERVQLRTVEHIADVVPMVQILDIPVPQMENQLVAVLSHIDSLVPEQVSPCPGSHGDPAFRVRFSASRRRRNSWWKRRRSCLTWMLLNRPLTFHLAQVVVLAMEVTKLVSQDRVQQRLPSRTLSFQFLVVVFKVSIQIRGPQRFFSDPLGVAFQGVCRTFPRREKSEKATWQVGAGVVADSSSSTPRTRADPTSTNSGKMKTVTCG